MTVFDQFIEEMRPMHNHIGIVHDCDLVRLVGVMQDDDDHYYIVRSLRPLPGLSSREHYASAVGHFTSLKAGYPAADYARLDDVFRLNRAGPTDTFLVVDKRRDDVLSTGS